MVIEIVCVDIGDHYYHYPMSLIMVIEIVRVDDDDDGGGGGGGGGHYYHYPPPFPILQSPLLFSIYRWKFHLLFLLLL